MAIQPEDINYNESLVKEIELPDPLVAKDGSLVSDTETWQRVRRPEILSLFQSKMYGRMPGGAAETEYQIVSEDNSALGGSALRREIDIILSTKLGSSRIRILAYIPVQSTAPVPVFLGLNFQGNHSVSTEDGISLPSVWVANNEDTGIIDNTAREASRGINSERWPARMIIEKGFGLVTAYCGDLDPDFDDGFENGFHALFPRDENDGAEWGAIGAWAWGLHRIIDYLQIDSFIDPDGIALIGHSRLGKAALWAGATDQRAALVISNNSGCGGASISRRHFGETVARINATFPHWFCRNFHQYGADPSQLPMDQHMLIALVAPRPVYIASAAEDLWADPKGEYTAAVHADPVFELLGKSGIATRTMPGIHEPVVEGQIGYHIRSGKHNITEYDWSQYLSFAERHLKKENR